MQVLDSYGCTDVYKTPGKQKLLLPCPPGGSGLRSGEKRYLMWVHYSPANGIGTKSYETLKSARRSAKRWERMGYHVRISDRTPRPGDRGWVAGSSTPGVVSLLYRAFDDDVFLVGTYEEIEEIYV